MTNSNDNKPSHTIWQVIGEGDKKFWNKVGAAWPNQDGKGYNLRFDSIPLSGSTVMRVIPEKHGEPEAASTEAAE